MGFFAVVTPQDGPAHNRPIDEQFEVLKLDINVWCLPGLGGRFLLLCDVGVRIRATTDVTHVDIAIPFRTQPDGLIDLSDRLADPSTASLVFGEPVVGDNNHPLDSASDYAVRAPISTHTSELLGALSNDTFSLWRLYFVNHLEAGQERYFRIRVRPTDFGRVFTWRRVGLRRVGALVDVHVDDPREVALVPSGSRYEELIVPARSLGVYIIVIASMRTRKASPELRYQRLLEARKWERYLDRATDLRRRERFLIHCWRVRRKADSSREFRGFLELGRRTETLGWPSLLAVSVLTTVLMLASDANAQWRESRLDRWLSSLGGRVQEFLSPQVSVVLALGLMAAFVLVADFITYARPLRRWVVRMCRAFEDLVYRKRADL
jgi:hypothetical protein